MLKLCPVRFASATWVAACLSLIGTPVDAKPPTEGVGFATYGLQTGAARRIRRRLREAANGSPMRGLVDPRLEEAVFNGNLAPDPAEAVAAARRRLDRGETQLRAVRIAEAKESVESAEQLLAPHVGRIAARRQDQRRLYLAVSIAHAERDEDAMLVHLRAFVQRFTEQTPDTTPWPPEVRERLATLRQNVPMVEVSITSLIAAQAAINGRRLGATPVRVRVPSGRHRIEVTAAGTLAQAVWVTVPDRPQSPVTVQLTPGSTLALELRKAERLTPGLSERIRAEAAGWGITTVYAVGPADEKTVRITRLDAGGLGPAIEVGTDTEALRSGLSQLWPAPGVGAEDQSTQLWPWITAGAGAAAVGAGIAVRLVAKSTQDDFQTRRPLLTQTEAFELRDQANAEATTGTVLIGVGLAAVAGGITWAIIDWLQEEEP